MIMVEFQTSGVGLVSSIWPLRLMQARSLACLRGCRFIFYLKVEGKHVFLAACRSSFFLAHGKLLELMDGALAWTSLEPDDLG